MDHEVETSKLGIIIERSLVTDPNWCVDPICLRRKKGGLIIFTYIAVKSVYRPSWQEMLFKLQVQLEYQYFDGKDVWEEYSRGRLDLETT